MTTWPSGSVPTTNLDNGADSPASARADLKTMADKVNDMIGARGSADGVASLDAGGLVPVAQLPAFALLNGIQVYDTAGGPHTFVIPAGTKKFLAIVTGGGGGGGFRNTSGDGGGGGGSGATAIKLFTVATGVGTASITVGAGGAGGATGADNDGVNGSNTSVTYNGLTVTGGGGGGGDSSSDPKGGGPGVAANGDFNIPGGTGNDAAIGANRGGPGAGSFWTYSGGTKAGVGGTGSGADAAVAGVDGAPGCVVILY